MCLQYDQLSVPNRDLVMKQGDHHIVICAAITNFYFLGVYPPGYNQLYYAVIITITLYMTCVQ